MGKTAKAFLLALAIVAVLAVPVAVFIIAPMTYAGLLERAVRAGSGFDARFTALEVGVLPPRITVHDLQLFERSHPDTDPVLTLDRLAATLAPLRYLQGGTDWWTADVAGGELRLTRDGGDRNGWLRTLAAWAASPPAADEPPVALLAFAALTVTDLDLIRVMPDQTHRFHLARLSLERTPAGQLRIEGAGNYRERGLDVTGVLALSDEPGKSEIDLQASVFGIEAALDGTLAPDAGNAGTVRFSARAADLSTIGVLFDRDLGALAPLRMTGTLRVPLSGHWEFATDGEVGERQVALAVNRTGSHSYRLKRLRLTAGDQSLHADATIDSADRSITAHLSSERLDSAQWTAPGHLPDVPDTPATLASRVDGLAGALEEFGDWSLELNVELGRLGTRNYRLSDLSLQATHAPGMRRIELDASAQQVNATGPAGHWQLREAVQVHASLNPGSTQPFSGRFATGGLEGQLQAEYAADDRDRLIWDLQTSLDTLPALQGIETGAWAALLPVSLSTRARVAGPKLYLEPLEIAIHHKRVQGRLVIDRSSRPLGVSGDLHAQAIDLGRVAMTTPAQLKDVAADIDRASGPVFDSQALDWSWLDSALLDLTLRIDALTVNETRFRDVRAAVSLEGGELAIDPLEADLQRGGVRGYTRIRRNGDGAGIHSRLIVTRLVPADLGLPGKGLIDGGETDLFLDLQARGASQATLAASLNGEIVFEIQQATIHNNVFDILGSDLVKQTVRLLNPFLEEDDVTRLKCAAVHFTATDGVLKSREHIVIETSRMIIRGGGSVDLGAETLDLGLVPSSREGLGLSLGDLTGPVEIGGTLGRPQVGTSATGVLKTGATVGAALATSGVSLLAQGLFNRLRNAATDCGRIFENNADIPAGLAPPDDAADPE